MKKKYVIALDQGTTSSRAIIFDKSGINPGEVAAIGVTNQRKTAIVWDKITGVPVCNAIVWHRRRPAGGIVWTGLI